MPGLAVFGSSNSSAVLQLRRVAAAVLDRGIDVAIVLADLGPASEQREDDFMGLGAELFHLKERPWIRGPFKYPSPLALVPFSGQICREIDALAPDAVLTHVDSFGLYRIAHWWAKSRGVPGIVAQEGAAVRNRMPKEGQRARIRLHPLRRLEATVCRRLRPGLLVPKPLNDYAEHVLAWGDAMRRRLEAHGRRPAQITVTGSPAFDHVLRREPLADRARESVLFAHQHQTNPRAELAFCREIIDVCANKLGCRLLFRPHPRSRLTEERLSRLIESTTENASLIEVATRGTLEHYLSRASVFVTFYSTSIYHALVHGVPVVLGEWVSDQFVFDAAKYGAAVVVGKPGDLEAALRSALWDRELRRELYVSTQRVIDDHLYRLDGRASERSALRIEEILKSPMTKRRH